MEAISVTRFDSPPTDNAAPLYRNRSLPAVQRSQVEVGIYADGSSNWVITRLTPTIFIPSPQANIPPDDTPQTHRTIIRNGNAEFFDKSGKLLHSHRMQMPSFMEVFETLHKHGNAPGVASRVAAGFGADIDVTERLTNARKKGFAVTDMGRGFVAIRGKVDRASTVSGTRFDGKEKKVYTVDMLDTINKVILGTRLYDENGDKLLAQTLFKYENGRELTQSSHQTYGVDPQGVSFTSTTDTYYRNLEVTSSITTKNNPDHENFFSDVVRPDGGVRVVKRSDTRRLGSRVEFFASILAEPSEPVRRRTPNKCRCFHQRQLQHKQWGCRFCYPTHYKQCYQQRRRIRRHWSQHGRACYSGSCPARCFALPGNCRLWFAPARCKNHEQLSEWHP